MLLSQAPSKLVLPFAGGGSAGKNVIPVDPATSPGAASFSLGFPPLTRVKIVDGGVPPSGLDMNGVLFDLSAVDVWMCAGAGFPFDSVFASAIGGYPKSARVLNAAGTGYWLSIIDNNSNNPDTGGAGWVPEGGSNTVSSVYAAAQQTLAMGASKVLYDTVEFDNLGQWDATNTRFRALWNGHYRLSGSTYLPSAPGQTIAADVYKNGTLAKRCNEFPQVSDEGLSYAFNVVLALSINDYVEAFLNLSQNPALAGQAESNQAFVFSQFEFLGQ